MNEFSVVVTFQISASSAQEAEGAINQFLDAASLPSRVYLYSVDEVLDDSGVTVLSNI